MRLIAVAVFVFFFLVFGSVFLGVEWIVGKFNKHHVDLMSLRNVQWAFRCVMFFSGVKLTVKGHENVPKDEAVMYVGNHRGFFDIVATYSLCPNVTGYVAKKSMEKVPLLSFFMKRLYCLFIDRNDIKQSLKVILQAIDQVKAGVSICIFPEGTRNTDREHPEQLMPFKEGSFKIAQKTGCKIIPMAILGTDDIFENHLPWIHKGNVTIVYGEPILLLELEEHDRKHPGAYCQRVIEGMLREELKLPRE